MTERSPLRKVLSLVVLEVTVADAPSLCDSCPRGSGMGEPDTSRELDDAPRDRAKTLRRGEPRVRDEAFLAHVGGILGASLDASLTARAIASLSVPPLADLAILDVIEPKGDVRRFVADLEQARQIATPFQLDLDGAGGAAVFRTGRSHVSSELTLSWMKRELRDSCVAPEGAHSAIQVRLEARGRALGVLTLVADADRPRYTDADLPLIEELARRGATALDNARQYEEARAATLRRDELLTVVSHDLKSPLTALLINTMRLHRQLGADGAPHASRALADTIRRGADRLRHFVQELLDLERVDAGRLALVKRRHDPVELIGEVLEMLQPLADAKRLKLTPVMSYHRAIPCDRQRFVQILSNLVGNAIKFTPEGGLVEITIEARGRDEVLFRVRDTGQGIPKDQLELVFDRMWRAPGSVHDGIGLGLSIARGLVEAHGGTLWVESEVDTGSTFSFTLPTSMNEALPPR